MSYNPKDAGCLCDSCPLNGSEPVPPSGPADAEFVVVAESPGHWEVKKGVPLVGPSGVMFDDILYYAGLKRSQFFLTNVILCRPTVPGVEGKDRYDMRRYMAYLHTENARRSSEAKRRGKEFEPIPSPIECCAPRLWRELAHFEAVAKARGQPNGAVVIAMGNYACEAVTGRSGIMKLRGSPMAVDIGHRFEKGKETS